VKSFTILLDSIDKVRVFVNAVGKYEGEFDIISERYIIDAKSIMGIFSLDLSKPLKLNIHAPGSHDEMLEEIKQFIVE